MDEAPRLSAKDVETELDAIYARRREQGLESPRHLFAIFGKGADERVTGNACGAVDVVAVRSELELRERLPPLGERERRIAFLVPFTRDVPLDLAGRFHRDGKVVRIGPEARIRRMFGVASIDDAVRASPLVTMLLAAGGNDVYAASSATLDVGTMWATWLHRAWGVGTGEGISREVLLAWAARDARGPTFLAGIAPGQRAEVENALVAHLGTIGAEASAVFRAWRVGRGRDALELALVFDALAKREEAVARMFIRDRAAVVLGVADDDEALRAGLGLAAAAGGALALLERDGGMSPASVRSLLRDADQRATLRDIRELLGDDPRLPAGWSSRVERLGRALSAGAASPSALTVQDAARALRALESHRWFHEAEGTIASRAEMAVRLLAWLAERNDAEAIVGETTIADAEGLGRWYAHEGGFVDWARHAARGSSEDVLGRGITAVLRVADDARLELDRKFARSLKAYVQARRQSSMMLPLDRVTERLASKFLDEKEERRLLVLLIDGMGWAEAAQILVDLEDRHVGPIAWNTSKKGRIAEGTATRHNTVLAALPTITEVSRSGFFQGAPQAQSQGDTGKDVERFASNKNFARFFSGPARPTLLLRGDLTDSAGHLISPAREAVRDPSARVVGLVINAIDASLKGDPQVGLRWTADTIKPLVPLLEEAREAGRTVLIVSDHGHVRADLFEPGVRAPDAGARWRPWRGDTDVLADWEMVFEGEGVAAPRGARGVVLITDDRHRYSTGPHAGEHGGATLAEVVVPCLFVGFDEASQHLDGDPELAVRHFEQPSFWRYEVRERRRANVPVRPPAQMQLIAGVPLVLVRPAAVAAPPPPPKPVGPPVQIELFEPLAMALRESAVLAALTRHAAAKERVIVAVSFLESRGGVASEAAFTAELKEPARKVGQLVSVLQEALNVDSFPILTHDRTTREVRLDRELLIQQFQLPR